MKPFFQSISKLFTTLKIILSSCFLNIYDNLGGGGGEKGRFKPSFARPSSYYKFPAFAPNCPRFSRPVCRANGAGWQSFLFLTARPFLSIFQCLPVLRRTNTANTNLYQVSPCVCRIPARLSARLRANIHTPIVYRLSLKKIRDPCFRTFKGAQYYVKPASQP